MSDYDVFDDFCRARSPKTPITGVGARVRIILTRLNWTQRDLATAMGCTAQNVSGLIRARRVRPATLKRLAMALGVGEIDLDPRYRGS